MSLVFCSKKTTSKLRRENRQIKRASVKFKSVITGRISSMIGGYLLPDLS